MRQLPNIASSEDVALHILVVQIGKHRGVPVSEADTSHRPKKGNVMSKTVREADLNDPLPQPGAVPKTYFGLDVVEGKVRYADIEKLPFFAFWLDSMAGSGMPHDSSGEVFVWLHDWENFCVTFIRTGRHRYSP